MQEAMAFQELLFSDTWKRLVHVFFSQHATSKVKNKEKSQLVPGKKMSCILSALFGAMRVWDIYMLRAELYRGYILL